jgi:hypothetical protein
VSKFSAEVPKGDGWGIEEVVQEIVEEIIAGNKSRLVPVMGVIDVKEVKLDPESGTHIAVVRVRRLEAITSIERARKAQKMILEQVAERRGEGTVLPFEEKDILERAFGGSDGVNVGQQLQDDQEKSIDEELDERGRMLRHIVAVHDHDPSVLGAEDDEVRDQALRWHDEQHALDADDKTFPDHDPESTTWRRIDLADMIGDAEEPPDTTPESDTDQADPDADEDAEGHGFRSSEDVFQENADADDQSGVIPEFRDADVGDGPDDEKPEGEPIIEQY